MRRYEENPVWLIPVLLVGGGIAAYFAWGKIKESLGPKGSGQLSVAAPGLLTAAVIEFMVKKKLPEGYQRYADYSSLAAIGHAGYSALVYRVPPPAITPVEKMGYEKEPGVFEKSPSFTNVEAGKILKQNFGLVPIVKVDVSEPEVGTMFDAFHFKITNLGAPKDVVWRLEGKPGWEPGGKVSAWATGPKKWMDKGEEWGITENVYFSTWATVSEAAAKFQYRILLALDESFAPERLYMVTPWINHYSE